MDSVIAKFGSISLQDLNEKAEMLDRLDNKYILSGSELAPVLSALTDSFDVLEIDGKRSFSYSTCYFDDVERRGYYDHHQRRRKRCKVRVRQYVDAGLSFLEVKLNERRSMTSKRRLKIEKPVTELDDCCTGFVKDCYRDTYGDDFEKQLLPVIRIEYQRITLVAKEGGERLTLDTRIEFHTDQADRLIPTDTYIIETKSARANGIADKLLRAQHIQPTSRVSKYCIGMAVTSQVVRHNGFLPALRRLEVMDLLQAA